MTNQENPGAHQQEGPGHHTPEHGGWQPTPQGDYDHDATAFVHIPPSAADSPDAPHGAPLEAPGHGYVPPMILPLTPAAEPPANLWPEPAPGDQLWPGTPLSSAEDATGAPGAAPLTHQGNHPAAGTESGGPHDTVQWDFAEADRRETHHSDHADHSEHAGQSVPAYLDSPHGGHPYVPAGAAQPPAADVTGQWTIPVAGGDLPDETGEYTSSTLQAQLPSPWGTAPATLPGGATAPWAADAPATLPGGAPAPWATQAPPEPKREPRSPGQAGEPVGPGADEAVPVPPERVENAAGAVTVAGTEVAEAAEAPEVVAVVAEGAGRPGAATADEAASAVVQAAEAAEVPVAPVAPEVSEAAVAAVASAEQSDAVPAAPAGAGNDAPAPVPAPEPPVEHAPAAETADTVPAAEGAAPEGAAAHPVPATATEPGEDSVPAPAETATDTDHTAATDGGEEHHTPADEHPATSYVLKVNGTDCPVTEAWIGESLLYVLRERLGLAGAKDGCSQGECGACNVQVDGRLVASCLVPAATTAGSEIRTVEGLATDGEPSDVQRALAARGAVQCGFCIPGMAMTVHDLLEGNHNPSELETRQALCGNLCRCTGYRGVLDAVRDVVARREASAAALAETAPGAESGPEARIPHQAPPGAGSVQPHPHDGGMA
ncbi:2Fe-2S iron-sulfur cluster-binding protein [Streptomyces sp. NPDC057638]|uniref:(2Fe-2S)-binding protein n=1 Tax=Streptomyces sp. NPDC057638 TaxID=3346190 RepID=UPI0036783298